MKTLSVLLAAAWGLVAASGAALAQSDAPVKIIVPFSAGSSTSNLTARALADQLQPKLGRPVVVENQPGANGAIGQAAVSRAAPDGETLLLTTAGGLVVGPTVVSNFPYDPINGLKSVAMVAQAPFVLVVPASLGISNLQELIALAKEKPDTLNFASAGVGSTTHLTGEMFNRQAGVHIQHIPFKGSGDAMTELLAGRVHVYFTGPTSVASHLKAGQLKAIGIASMKRSPFMPDVPTLDEQGLKDFDVGSWVAIMAPPETPDDIVGKYNDAVNEVVATPEFQKFLTNSASNPFTMEPDEMSRYVKAEYDRWTEIVEGIDGLKK